MGFAGVYRATYGYTATNEQELTVAEDDLLYLLQTADDGWWTVKKRVAGAATEEPEGIVPHNYIAPATPTGQATALYAYDRQTDEELTFAEGAKFDVYASDGDWILVGLQNKKDFGFVPNNYIQVESGASAAPTAAAVPDAIPSETPATAATTYAPGSPASAGLASESGPPQPQRPQSTGDPATSPEENAPPRPSRPGRRPTQESRDRELPDEPISGGRARGDSTSHGEAGGRKEVTWPVVEINGRRKIPKTLVTAPSYVTLINDDGGGRSQKWDVHDITSYNSEKKHVFLDLRHPTANLDLKVTSQQQADQIVAALGQIVGAGRGGGLEEVLAAAKSAGHKQGIVLLDFKAANGKEVTVREGDTVFVADDSDKDWWLVRTTNGREGLVPRKFIQVDRDGRKLSEMFKGRKQRERQREREHEHAKESAREAGRQRDREQRREAESRESYRPSQTSQNTGSRNRSPPDSRKLRLWVDRSGSFRVEAALLGCSDGKVHLHKANGVKIAVPASKLSVSDVEYVEGVTGVNLSEDKPLQGSPKRTRSRSSTTTSNPAAMTETIERSDSWLTFFLESGIDPQNANRYAKNFTRDNMDDSVLAQVDAATLRTLGLREGDILRVTKKLNEKFGRNKATSGDGLYSTDGALRNNTGKTPVEVDNAVWQQSQGQDQNQPNGAAAQASQPTGQAIPVSSLVPQKTQPTPGAAQVPQAAQAQVSAGTGVLPQVTQTQTGKMPQLTQAPTGLAPQLTAVPTGALADLLGMTQISQPTGPTQAQLQAQKTAEAQLAAQQRKNQHEILRQQAELQKEQIRLLKEQQEQLRRQQTELVQIQRTGSQLQALGPFATGVAQPSPFVPSAASVLAAPPPPQPRGFQVQQNQPFLSQATTGPFQSQTTGFTSQFTGQTTGLQPQQTQRTGPFQSQTTGPFQSQAAGPFQAPQTTGPFQSQPTGSVMPQTTGPFARPPGAPLQTQMPTTSFQSAAQPQVQSLTGPFQATQPSGSFRQQPTGPFSQPSAATPNATGGALSGLFASQAPNGVSQPGLQTGAPTNTFSSFPLAASTTGPFQQQQQQQQQQPFQSTGAFQTQQPTGPFQANSFQTPQANGPFASQPQQFTGFQQASFPAPAQSVQNTFGQSTGQPFGQPAQQQQPFSTTFGQAPTQPTGQSLFGQPQQQPQSQQVFGQTSFGQSPSTFTPQQTTFGQAPFAQPSGGPAVAPQQLQSQATGFGFGNQPAQATSQPQQPLRANFNMASASNPFGL